MSSSLQILAAGVSWRLFGTRRAADTLLQAMNSDDEQQRMIAGMSLVKAGQRSIKVIESKIEAGEATAPIIRLLPDIGGERARRLLERIAGSASSDLRQAAGECIGLLDRIEELDEA